MLHDFYVYDSSLVVHNDNVLPGSPCILSLLSSSIFPPGTDNNTYTSKLLSIKRIE